MTDQLTVPDGPTTTLEIRAIGGGRLQFIADGEILQTVEFEPGEIVHLFSWYTDRHGKTIEIPVWSVPVP